MKSISTILSILALVLVAVLFYLHFSHVEKINKQVATVTDKKTNGNFKVAYFEIDSLQEHYSYYKDALEEMKKRESSMNAELTDMSAKYQRRIRDMQQKANSMTQSEGERAQQEYNTMQQNFQQRKAELEQDLQKHQVDKMQDVRKKIEDYLKVYNQSKGYAYILGYEPSFIIYYKDSAYNITQDLIGGLNTQYEQEKKK